MSDVSTRDCRRWWMWIEKVEAQLQAVGLLMMLSFEVKNKGHNSS